MHLPPESDSPPESSSVPVAGGDPRAWPLWVGSATLLVAACVAFRAWILFRTDTPPGVDAGYYPYQSRTLLELGRLAYDDAPLRFLLDAILAKLLMLVTGWSVDDATLWVSRAADATLQPLSIGLVVGACAVWSRFRRGAIPAALVASLIAVLPRPIVDMTGDFEKQSLALALAGATWLALWGSLRAPDARRRTLRAAVAAIMLLLTAATHVGTFAVALIGTVALLAARAALGGVSRRQLVLGAAASAAIALLAWLGIWWLAPLKATALVASPLAWLSGSGDAEGQPGGGWRGGIAYLAACVVLALVGIAARRRSTRCSPVPTADAAFVLAMLAVLAAVTCPLLPGEFQMRVGLAAFTPLALVVGFFLSTRTSDAPRPLGVRSLRAAVLLVIVAASVGSAAGARILSMPPTLSADGLADLQRWGRELGTDFRTVVVARHGLEWWAGYGMRSAVRMGEARASDFERYERVLVLAERAAARGGLETGLGTGLGNGLGNGQGGPPDGPRGQGRRDSRRGDDNRGPGGRMRLAPIPADATLLRESDRYRLYELAKPAAAR